jgi:hypothetical protein
MNRKISLHGRILASIENIENKTQELDSHLSHVNVKAQRVVSRELDFLSGSLGICPDGSFQDDRSSFGIEHNP